MSQEDAEKFLAELDGTAPKARAVPDDQFDDSFDQIKQQQ